MAKKVSASIGVEIGAGELRAVEVSADGRSIKKFASTAVANIPTERGVPSDPNSFAEVLRNLFRDLSPSGQGAVFGVPPLSVTTRVLDIPEVPDGELKVILEGEVQHFGIVRGFGGMFDFFRLAKGGGEDAAPQALVMASEAIQLNSIRDASERARIARSGIEPSLLGLIRLAATRHAKPDLGMLVAVAGDYAEVAIIHHGTLKLYRRIDLGVADVDDSFVRGVTGTSVPAFMKTQSKDADLNPLSIELKRTLDYAAREYKALGVIEKVVLAVSHPSEAALSEQLGTALDLTLELATAPLPGDDGIRFGAAYGLAIPSAGLPYGIPTFDLTPYDPVEEAHQHQRQILATSLVASIVLVLASIAGGFWFGKKANNIDHELGHEQEMLQMLQKVDMPEAKQRQSKLEQYRALSAFGLPVPQIVDSLTSKLDPKAGVEMIEITGPTLKISGEAVDEASMIRTLDQIRMTPGFKNAFIESFDQNADETRKFVKFRLSAQLGATSQAVGGQP